MNKILKGNLFLIFCLIILLNLLGCKDSTNELSLNTMQKLMQETIMMLHLYIGLLVIAEQNL